MDNYIHNVTGKLYINMEAKEWCKLPYPNHKKGCPNYNNNCLCPPNSPNIDEFIKIYRKHWFIVEYFDISKFQNKMKNKHPDWSIKKCRCLLYWQKGVKKILKNKVLKFINGNDELVYTLLPESMGIDVITTAQKLNIPIKRKPDNLIVKIALVGYKNFDDKQSKIIDFNMDNKRAKL